MSYTEMTFFGDGGKPKFGATVKNAWRGAMAIWNTMDERYLPPYVPSWAKGMVGAKERYYRMGGMDSVASKEVWGLWESEKVSRIDKIAMATTLDWVIVRKENIPELLAAFRSFKGDTSLPEQADKIEEAFKDETITAVGWTQTSVCENKWQSYEYDKEKDEEIPYDLNKDTQHWSLFEELNQQKSVPA